MRSVPNQPEPEPNFWVDQSITGDGTWVVGSTRDGGIVDSAATEAEAIALCAQMNEAEAGVKWAR
jgi:hypothetical protein